MRKFLYFSIISFFVCFSFSCRNDIEINAPRKDIMVVYGLMNQADSLQYLKIYKAFLGEGNANVMAKQADSIYYPEGALDVSIQRWFNNALKETFTLSRDTLGNLDSGKFAGSPNVVYYTNTNGKIPESKQGTSEKEGSEYRLFIYNKFSKDTLKGTTSLINGFKPLAPLTSPAGEIALVNNMGEYYSPGYRIKFAAAEYGKIYQVDIRFNYWESGVKKSLYWTIDKVKKEKETELTVELTGETFYKRIADLLKGTQAERTFESIDFIFSIGSSDLNTFLEVNSPSSATLLMDKPVFSNVKNGLGIFSSRYRYTDEKISGKKLNSDALNHLKTGPFTGSLGFK